MMYDQLAWLNDDIITREMKVPTSKEADIISKITSAIQRLEVETSVGQIVEVARSFVEFVRPIDLNQAKEITKLFDLFIQNKMK